jgi:hypothetical protein
MRDICHRLRDRTCGRGFKRKMETTSFTAGGPKKGGQRGVTIPLFPNFFFSAALGHSERVFPKFGRQASRIGEKERSKNIIHWPLSQACRKQTYLECKENGEGSEWSSDPVGWGSDRYGQGKVALILWKRVIGPNAAVQFHAVGSS